MFLVFLLIFFIGNGIHQTDGQSDNFFSSWKEPPINSGIGEGNATVTLRENSQAGTSTGIKLQVLGGTGKISYILQQPNPLHFSVGGANKDEITTVQPIDFEKLDRITVTVIAFDEGIPQKTGSAIMTIFIGDVNEHAPTFLQEVYEVTISPLSDIGIPFAMVHAADEDGSPPNNKVVYSIEGGNTNGAFMVDSITGNIAMAKQLDGYDIMPQYELIILGVDGGTDPSPLTGTTTMLVKIIDVETFSSWKQPPVNSGIGSGTASLKVKENSEKGTITNIKLRVLGGNGNITYKIKSEQKTFSIGGPNGNALIVEEPIDFEVVSSISILVEAKDNSSTAKTGRVNMTILIEDINDNAPVFEKSNYKEVVSDSSPIGFILVTVKATDSDGTAPNNEVIYTFADDNTHDEFTIDSSTGVLSLAKHLKETSTSSYELMVIATDGGVNPGPLTGSTMVSISVDKDPTTMTSAGTSTTTQLNTPMPGGTGMLAPCLFTILLHVSLLIVY
ncbi:protocadherin Fat 4-like isoform X1 [Ruditapes philippinarum]|uniref:protocadherin Fat 4-like isoform X1 n=1 Tax=Ruditapes philippinarum TaxID=129788 RepID=UPI00295B56CF|nr:protocadherin Fat 4-like isoform X1 [Ruditapes philippinarum]